MHPLIAHFIEVTGPCAVSEMFPGCEPRSSDGAMENEVMPGHTVAVHARSTTTSVVARGFTQNGRVVPVHRSPLPSVAVTSAAVTVAT
jgi:hypothetical protein